MKVVSAEAWEVSEHNLSVRYILRSQQQL